MKTSENLVKIQELLHSCVSDCKKFEKGNFQASIRLRNGLARIKTLCVDVRAEVLESRAKK